MDGKISLFTRILANIISVLVFSTVGSVNFLFYVLQPKYKRIKDRPIPPKCLTDPKKGDHKYINANGLKFHYVERGDHSKPLLLFVHGFPEFWYSWRHQLEEFSKDYWCVAVDMRGFGDTEKPKGRKHYRTIIMVNDIKELVTALGRERFTLVSHDWGAVITWEFVQVYGDMLDCFVAMSGPSSEVWSTVAFSELWQFLHIWYVFFFQGPCLPEMAMRSDDLKVFNRSLLGKNSKVTEDDIEAYKYTFSMKGAFTPPINYYRENFLKSFIPRGKKIPRGLYVIGEKDPYISVTTAKLMGQYYDGLETKILKEGRHFIQQEQPEEVNEIIRNFITK
ncbi:epoxide hydrolase 4-like [Arctopsyche grandis]|uniref:epoxide hydrolase 4-like n=1 Tax=Arctopsyche grandis TaxID=121162 RepID=UPI00406D7056